MAAKILGRFGGYTVETLLAEPLTIFLRLHTLADRVKADDAIDMYYESILAALSGNRGRLERRRGPAEIYDFSNDEIDPKEWEAAQKLAKEVAGHPEKFKTSHKITKRDLMKNV